MNNTKQPLASRNAALQQAITGIITLPAVLQRVQSGTAGQHFMVSLSNVKCILKIKDYKKVTKGTNIFIYFKIMKRKFRIEATIGVVLCRDNKYYR
jgi:hypothetical protein